ncbi:hypothetical protein JXC34_07060 [Candidatus Woesearchaeota archaeon]|nr:hypothetical protein [Candidatus Woesearchaeota archaeon]
MYYSVLEETRKVGINTDTDALWFGRAGPGSLSERRVNLTNEYDFPVTANVLLFGNISEFVSVSDNNFVLQPGGKKTLTYFLQTSFDTPPGDYSGHTRIVIKRSFLREE